MDAPIGVFDSGVGGLTVVREIMRQLPSENVIYFGDTARVPYGSKSKQTVLKFSKQIVRFLMTKNVKAIVAGHFGVNHEQKINGIMHIATKEAPCYRIIDIIDYETENPTFWSTIKE